MFRTLLIATTLLTAWATPSPTRRWLPLVVVSVEPGYDLVWHGLLRRLPRAVRNRRPPLLDHHPYRPGPTIVLPPLPGTFHTHRDHGWNDRRDWATTAVTTGATIDVIGGTIIVMTVAAAVTDVNWARAFLGAAVSHRSAPRRSASHLKVTLSSTRPILATSCIVFAGDRRPGQRAIRLAQRLSVHHPHGIGAAGHTQKHALHGQRNIGVKREDRAFAGIADVRFGCSGRPHVLLPARYRSRTIRPLSHHARRHDRRGVRVACRACMNSSHTGAAPVTPETSCIGRPSKLPTQTPVV